MIASCLVLLALGLVSAAPDEGLASSSDCAAGVCRTSEARPPRSGSAMLQVVGAPEARRGALLEVEGSSRSPADVGDSAALTEEGYAMVGGTCCVAAMEAFVRRVVGGLGLAVCNEGGFQGVVGWHTCEKGLHSLAKLIEDIHNSENVPCAWVGTPGYCPDFDFANCGSFPDNFHRRRICSSKPYGTDAPAPTGPTTAAPATTAVPTLTNAPATSNMYSANAAAATAAPTTAAPPTTTAAPVTTAYPGTTAAPATTTVPATTAAPATAAPTTTAAPVTTGYPGALIEERGKRALSQGIGATAELTEEGYSAVAGTCCTFEMEEFARRVVEDLGRVVCNEGGLSGVVGYHTCDKGVQTLAKLIEDIHNSEQGQCAWVGLPGYCQDFDWAYCGLPPDGFHRRRVCTGGTGAPDAYSANTAAAATTDIPTTAAPATTAEPAATDSPATSDMYSANAAVATAAPTTAAPTTTAAPVTTAYPGTTTAPATTTVPATTAAPATAAPTTTAAPVTTPYPGTDR